MNLICIFVAECLCVMPIHAGPCFLPLVFLSFALRGFRLQVLYLKLIKSPVKPAENHSSVSFEAHVNN